MNQDPVPKSTRIAIIGSRDFPHQAWVEDSVQWLAERVPGLVIISGGARGPDRWAQAAAEKIGVPTKIFLADWDRLGKSAGMVRNRDIIGHADLVIAFWDGLSRGTRNSIDLARTRGIECWIVQP